MARNTKIEWADNSWNAWWTCKKVSPGCTNCYAESLSDRTGYPWSNGFRFFGGNHWRQLYSWNRYASKGDKQVTVFANSMSDLFQDHPDLVEPRQQFWKAVLDCQWLTFLLLTKRPENVERMIPEEWLAEGFPANVWLGVSIESQEYIHRLASISHLTVCRFVSAEPLLGPLVLHNLYWAVDWMIIGGESGPSARKTEQEWISALIDECEHVSIPVFVKQLGSLSPGAKWGWANSKGDDIRYWPLNLRVREVPIF